LPHGIIIYFKVILVFSNIFGLIRALSSSI
jgi:hypothetical protein